MPIHIADTKLYSLLELSDVLGVSLVTLRVYIKDRRLIGQKLGGKWFISETNLKEFLDNKAAKTEMRDATLAGHSKPAKGQD